MKNNWIAIDWGTTNFRAFLLENNQVIARLSAPCGLLSVKEAQFAATLQRLLAPWLNETPHLPIVMAVMVQYAPGETGLAITPQQLATVAARYPHAVFKIECNPPVDYTREFLVQAPQASVLNGYAGLYMLPMLEAGGKGVMPGCSFAEIYTRIYRHWLADEHDRAQALHQALLPYIQRWMRHCEYIIQVEKTILMRRGIIASDYCRHPGWQLSADDNALIDAFITQFELSTAANRR
jgi:4-hydroxy-tetrahydrodipicolinate synthase